MLPVLSPDQSAAWDRRAEAAGIALATLMDAAGRAVAAVLAARYPDRLGGGVLIAAGPGNNGGDGWVAARALHRLEVPVFVAQAAGTPSALNRDMAALARAEGVRVVEPDGPWPAVALAVDALLGTGASGAPRPAVAALVERLGDLAVPLAAVDGPTGVDLATGVTHGPAVRAELCVTFGGLRRGHLLARDDCGAIVVVDIGHPAPDPEWPAFVTEPDAARLLPPLPARAHKGTRGRLVVVGGDAGMSGALRMTCRAAFAAGAGLVHAVAPPETIATLMGAEPDVQTLPHPLGGAVSAELAALVERADAVVAGPGLGRGDGRLELILDLAARAPRLVLDADALNALAGGGLPRLRAAAGSRPVVLTPHPGEFRRLFPEVGERLDLDPWSAAAAAARSAGVTLLLKGVPTVVATPDAKLLTLGAGNPGLATGGSGDVLSGLVATALAQSHDPRGAAALGAQALGKAAELAARRTTARALRPMDVMQAIPDVWRAWEVLNRVRPAPRPPVLLELEAPQAW